MAPRCYYHAMLALLYDVHGNLPALEAVLADARRRGVERYVLGGDYALFGGWPRETVDLLRTLTPALWIRGNADRWTQAPDEGVDLEAVAFTRAGLGDELVADLAALPERAHAEDALVCHASPVSDVRSFLPEPAEDEAELLAGVAETRVVFGHTHLPFRRVSPHGGVELVNPGSVGMPLDGDHRAAYALVAADGTVEHRRVAYDHTAAVAKVRAAGPGGWTEVIGRRLEVAGLEG
jgi:predicted phosphodiesterase